jgi:hypothetical protein
MDYEKILDDLYADMEANPAPPSPVGSRLVPGGQTQRDDSWFTGWRNDQRKMRDQMKEQGQEEAAFRRQWNDAFLNR